MRLLLAFLLFIAALPVCAAVPPSAVACAQDLAWLKEHRPLAPVAAKLELPHEAGVDVAKGLQDLAARGVKFMNLNAENMELFAEPEHRTFDLTGHPAEAIRQKALSKTRALAEHILAHQPDVVVMQEVVGQRSAEKFANEFLGGEYVPLILPSNDKRGIHVAVLVKRGLPLDFTYESHANEPNADGTGKVFDRDVVALTARAPGKEEPLFVMLGSHFKSKRSSPGHPDDEGSGRRTAQAEAMARIIAEYHAKWPKVPVFASADYNNVPSTAPEYQILRTTAGMQDTIDAQPGGGPKPGDPTRVSETTFLPQDERTGERIPFPEAVQREHDAHRENRPSGVKWVPSSDQLDGILANPPGQKLVKKAGIDPWLTADGQPKPPPTTREEREANPTDHNSASTVIDPTSRLQELGIDVKKPEPGGPGFREFKIPPVYSHNGTTHPFGIDDLKIDGFLPVVPNSNPPLTLANGTVVGLKNFGRRIQQDRSTRIPRELLDRDHLILIPKNGQAIELVPDPGYSFGPVLATPKGFRSALRPIGKAGPERVVEFDERGQRRP